MHSDIGERGDDLLFRREVWALFEFEIANRSGKREIAVDAAKVDKASGCRNSCLFAFVLRLVIKGERFRPPLDPENCSRVASVADIDFVRRHDADGSCAAGDFFLVFWIWHRVSACRRVCTGQV